MKRRPAADPRQAVVDAANGHITTEIDGLWRGLLKTQRHAVNFCGDDALRHLSSLPNTLDAGSLSVVTQTAKAGAVEKRVSLVATGLT